jgi:hypothetical protein
MHKCESWKIIDIGQSAAKPRIGERSSTIPKGSRGNPKKETYGFIYLFLDPITTEVKYVGKTTRNVLIRIAEHFRLRESTANIELKNFLAKHNCEPTIMLKKYPIHLLDKAEKYWINYYKQDNKLLNFSSNTPSYNLNFKDLHKVRKVARVNLHTGELTEYSSTSEAADKNGVHIGNISQCLSGKRKSTGGFAWISI